jgi:hypothetical protein
MTEETKTQETTQDPSNNISISIEQICAAILATVGSIEVPLASLVTDYSSKSIAVNQDPETKAITFSLADAIVAEQKTEGAE